MNSRNGENSRPLPKLLNGRETAAMLGITVKTLWEWVNRGIIPQVKLPGAKPKYDLRDIEIIIEQHKSFAPSSLAAKEILQTPK